jgi:hypothetical protein
VIQLPINYKKCPKCGANNSIPIIYGLPAPELFEKAEAKKVKLGGCCVEANSPQFFCKECNNEWNKDQAIDNAYRQIQDIKASVGGFFGGTNLVEVDLVNLIIIWTKSGGGMETEIYQKIMSAKTAEQFIDHLKLVNLLDWRARYDSDILDGIQWSLKIFREGKNLHKFGSNAFPDEWDAFCSIIGKVAGRRFK